MKKFIKWMIQTILKLVLNFTKMVNNKRIKTLSKSFKIQWILSDVVNENELTFDHEIDLYHRLLNEGQFWFGEIATFCIEALRAFNKPIVLELGCSDGFYAYYFYRHIPNMSYLGIDLDVPNLRKAEKRLVACSKDGRELNVKNCDFLKDIPNGDYTNIMWFESINMFTEEEQEQILEKIACRLKERKGILCGDGVMMKPDKVQWSHYVSLWKNPEHVYSLLKKYFHNAYVYTMDNIPDDAIIFMASDGEMPVADGVFYYKKR